jgi:hypothetical protein
MLSIRKKSSAAKGQAKRDREATRSRVHSAAAREIGPIPPPADMVRRQSTETSFRTFCQVYFPQTFFKPFCVDHLKAIAKIERAVLNGGLFAFALPRGSGKTVLTTTAAAWALVHGHRPFVTLIGATEAASEQLLLNIKSALRTNELLAADFPEICYPIRALENDARRCNGQIVDGRKTAIAWTSKRLVLPTIENSKASGSIAIIAGLTGRIRGQNHALPDGRIIRPSLVIVDDPQTSESAWSDQQSQQRVELLNGDVLGLAGPGEKIAGIMPCTIIRAGDMASRMLDRAKNPEWQGETASMIYSFPTAAKLWEQYATLRADSLRADGDGKEATQFYSANREAMDAGASVAWAERFNSDELSAVQHAMNLRLRDEDSFFAEYQNAPRIKETVATMLSPDAIMGKLNGLAHRALPLDAAKVTSFVDIHDSLLFFVVVGWTIDAFSGYLIDYGTYPDQGRRYFTMREADRTMQKASPGAGKEGAILAGLQSLTTDLFSRVWTREDGAIMPLDRMLIDTGYVPDTIFQFIRASGRAGIIMGSRGVGIGAAAKPMNEYRRQPGEQLGHNWLTPKPSGRELRHVRFDSNFWKSFVHDRLALPLGDKGSLSLYGKSPAEHRLIAEHLTAEFPTATEGRGRQLQEWRPKPNHPDNHFLDAVLGCAVAASMCGCGRTAQVGHRVQRRPRSTAMTLEWNAPNFGDVVMQTQ